MKKIIFIIIVAILLIVINGLAHSTYDIWQKKDIVLQAQKELEFQRQENQRLKAALSYFQTPEFIEKQARDKLFMVKKGEQKILISKELESFGEEGKKDNDPNWKKWWDLFF